MSTKEELRGKAQKVRSELRDTGRVVLRLPVLVRTAEVLIRFLLGCMLAGAEIFGGYAPFGVGLVAASGSGTGAFAALLGACFGYLIFRGFGAGLPYVAACILTFSVSFAFFDVRLFRRTWFMPAISAALCGVTGFVYLAGQLTTAAQGVFFATELLLVGASAYFYRVAFSPWDEPEEDSLTPRQSASLLILGCTLLISLASVRLWGEISLGCLAAALAVMIAGWKGGAGTGAAVGICAGLAMDLSLGQAPHYTMAYGFSGLMTGVFFRQGKLFATLTYVLSNASVVLWLWGDEPGLSILYEVFIASVVFLVLPDRLLRRAAVFFTREQAVQQEENRAQAYVKEQLNRTADAFRELYDGLRSSFRRVASNDADGTGVFHRAANKVCVRCALQDRCWQREYASTMNALNDALPAMIQRGRGEAEDFPMHFRSRCLSFPLLLATANQELTALLYRRQFQSKARESRAAVCRQYGLLAKSLDQAARRLREEPVRDGAREKKLRQHLALLGFEGEAEVWYDPAGHLVVEASGRELANLKTAEETQRLSALLGVPLSTPEERRDGRRPSLRWRQAEPLMAVAGVSARSKSGETVSGDAGAWFKNEDGGLFVLLCDGMGSGPAAHRESSLAIRLLEKFLRAGISPEEALRTLNAGLALRGEAEGGFTTVDLFHLDLFTGEAGVYKLGAAPTYVKRKNLVSRVTGSAFPAGLNNGESAGADVARLRLEAGDCVVMVSDGVTAGEDDGWIKTALTAFDGTDPKGLAALLMEESARREGATDDRTAVVLAIKAR